MSRLGHGARRVILVLVVATGLFWFGAPRFFNSSDTATFTPSRVNFDKLCRDHGGAPSTVGEAGPPQKFCVVRYGDRDYVMDAITTNGFDNDAALLNRQGCEQAAAAEGAKRRAFVYHANTGVCEHRR